VGEEEVAQDVDVMVEEVELLLLAKLEDNEEVNTTVQVWSWVDSKTSQFYVCLVSENVNGGMK
jgi:hypothetical protein